MSQLRRGGGFSVVLPIHNEANLLSLTLRSVFNLTPEEILIGLDRCTDNSEKIINAEAEKHLDTKTRIKTYTKKDGAQWRFRPAYLRRDLYNLAHNDTILNTSADLYLDPHIHNHLQLGKNRLISFGYLDYPYTYQCFMRRILSTVNGFTGLLAFSQKAWLETEDLKELQTIQRAEDTHLHQAIRSRYPTKHIHTHSLHLRPNESKRDHLQRGEAQNQVQHKTQISSLLHSIIMLRPGVFVGYRHAKGG